MPQRSGKIEMERGRQMDAAQQFTGKAAIYDRSRPGYPPQLLDWWRTVGGPAAGDTVADVGAGSGIFTQLLLERGLAVYAVEPNQDMGAALQKRLAGFSHWQWIARPAEQTGLAAGSLRAVTVAQAFHWLDAARFRAECQRILAPEGQVLLVWNSRDPASQLVRENEAICKAYCPSFLGFSGGRDPKESVAHFFQNGNYQVWEAANPLSFDWEGFLGRNLSSSYAPRPQDASYSAFVQALHTLFERWSNGGVLVLPNHTRCYVGNV